MNPDDHGGPAFPVTCAQTDLVESYGMLLRDYFAAQALMAILANPGTKGTLEPNVVTMVAMSAYGFADAMLKERTRQA